MKKRIVFLSCAFVCILTGCVPEANPSSSGINKPAFYGKSDILFTEFITGSSPSNRALEISNLSDKDVSLDGYSVNIYRRMETTPKYKISLNGKQIKAKSSFVIASSDSKDLYTSKADLVTADLVVDGTWPVALVKDNKIVDMLGQIGYQTEYGKQKDLVRKDDYLENKESFDSYEWIAYQTDDVSRLGNYYDSISDVELLWGPKLTEEMASLPFIYEKKGTYVGGGGFIEVDLAYCGDGDTTNFYFPSSLREYGIGSRESTRYLKINTPETQHGTEIDAQPWGYKAQEYNNSILNSAKHYIVQTERDSSFRETYDRMLLYVWYSNESNPQLSDYKCLNFEMVEVGLARCYFYDENAYNNPLLYKGISYTNFFLNAEAHAKKLGLKIHGEIDPDFNY